MGGIGKTSWDMLPPPVNGRISKNGFLFTSRKYLYFVKQIRLQLLKQLTAITKSIVSQCSKIVGGG